MARKGKRNFTCGTQLGRMLGLFLILPHVFWQGKLQLMEKHGGRLATGIQKIAILNQITRAAGSSPCQNGGELSASPCWPHPTKF